MIKLERVVNPLFIFSYDLASINGITKNHIHILNNIAIILNMIITFLSISLQAIVPNTSNIVV